MSDRAEPAPEASAAPIVDEGEISLAALAAVLLRGRWTVVRFAILGAVVGLLVARVPPAKFRSSAAFTPQSGAQSSLGGLASLAGQFGVQVPGVEGGDSPEFYQELLGSREILGPVLEESYEVGDDGERRTLVELIDEGGRTPAERLDRALEWFRRKALSSSVVRQTGIVDVSVTTRWPEVSLGAASDILAGIQDFDLQTRQTRARAERAFLEGRVDEARDDLLATESELQAFLQQNRQFSGSPELQFRYERLQRAVATRQQVYTGLVEAYEQARIQEVRNTPVITVLEEPILPPRRQPRGTVLKTLLGLILGGGLGLAAALLRGGMAATRDPDVDALRNEWAATRQDLRRWVPGRR